MKKIVLIISPNNFPNGDAGSLRDLSFAKIYIKLGYLPIIICRNQEHIHGYYNGIEYYSYFISAENKIDKIIRYFKQIKIFSKTIRTVEKKYRTPTIIHLYSMPIILIKYIKNYSDVNRIQIIHDSVERYSPSEFKYGVFDKAYIINNHINTRVIKSPMKVIAISSFLKNYYDSKGIITERIPVILDIDKNYGNNSKKDTVNFIYAGNPANKDYLLEIVQAFMGLSKSEKQRFQLDIYGISKEKIIDSGIVEDIDACIKFHGRVSREEVLYALKKSDFSVLLRPKDERYTKAGFPTKSVEAMSNGVAMLCNLTSDLDLYLKDGENSIIVEKCNIDSLKIAIRKAINLSSEEINFMKINAKKTAINHFDYRKRIDTVQKLIDE